jgi:hypothetical protein
MHGSTFALIRRDTDFGHEDLAQLAAPVRHPTIIRLCGFVFEPLVVDGFLVSHVGAGREGNDACAAGRAQLWEQVVNLRSDD